MRFPHFGSEVAGLQVADGKKQVRQYMTCNLLCVMVHWHINLQLRFGEHFVSPPPFSGSLILSILLKPFICLFCRFEKIYVTFSTTVPEAAWRSYLKLVSRPRR